MTYKYLMYLSPQHLSIDLNNGTNTNAIILKDFSETQ